MRYKIIIFFIAVFANFNLSAQLELDGLWQGTLTLGQSMKGYPMSAYFVKSGKKISGHFYIHINKNMVIETAIEGIVYKDFSIYIDDVKFVNEEDEKDAALFLRKYQVLWKRSIAGSSIRGHWQESRKDIFNKKRRRGQVFLTRVIDLKA